MSKRPLGQISEELKISKGELENWLSHPVTMALQASLKEYMSTLTALSDEAITNALELSFPESDNKDVLSLCMPFRFNSC